MNEIYSKYQVGSISYDDLNVHIKQAQFEKLIESNNKRFYNNKNSKSRNNDTQPFNRINCLDIDSQDKAGFLLSGQDDGSISLWSLDDRYYSEDHSILINKKLKTSKRSNSEKNTIVLDSYPTTKSSITRKTTTTTNNNDNIRLVHSFETRSNKFRLYRGSTHPSISTDTTVSPYKKQKTNDQDLEQESLFQQHKSHQYSISTVKWYGNDNGMFFSGGNDKYIKIWDTNKFKCVQDIYFDYKINQIDCIKSQQNFIVAASEDYFPRLIDLKNMNLGITIFGKNNKSTKFNNQMKSEILSCKINPKRDNIIVSSDTDGRVKLWDLRMTNQLMLELENKYNIQNKAHSKACNDVAWDSTGTRLVTTALDGKIILWNPFDNNQYTNKFNDNENMNYYDDNIISGNFMQIGDTDTMRNRYKKRTSQRLIWYDKYLIVNSDYGELQIFDMVQHKYWNKIEFPLELLSVDSNRKKMNGQFTGMVLQRDLSNSRGLRLLTGTSITRTLNNVSSMNSSSLIEYI